MSHSCELVDKLATALIDGAQRVCTAESCTGGLIAKTFTDLAGSSNWFERGYVTYSNASKTDMLGVPESIIDDYGAVSEPVAMAMASGALRHSQADFAVAVTGIAGPDGGSVAKPVGTVWIAVASATQVSAQLHQLDGDRGMIREATLWLAIDRLFELVVSR